MAGLRQIPRKNVSCHEPCGRCQGTGCRWDQIAGKSMCPDCQESLILGSGEPLMEPAEKKQCVVCGQFGTLRYITFPLVPTDPVEMDLCGDHLRSLLSRRLPPHSFHKLRRQLHALGLQAEHVFLLHEAFYDGHGRALQPALEWY